MYFHISVMSHYNSHKKNEETSMLILVNYI